MTAGLLRHYERAARALVAGAAIALFGSGAFAADPIQVPTPYTVVGIECEQMLFPESLQKENGEERVASALLVHQLRQWLSTP